MKPYLFLILLAISCHTTPKKEVAIVPSNTNEEQDIKKAITQYPDSLVLRENLIQYYRDNNEYAKAIAEADRSISTDSLNPRYWHIKAILHFENDDTLLAISSFEKELSIQPNKTAIVSLGTLYAQSKNKQAIELANVLTNNFKSTSEKEAYFIKGLYYSATKDNKQAINFFDKCIQLDFTFMEAYREKSIALYDLQKYNEAIAVLNRAVTLQNNYSEGYYYLGLCYEKIKNTEAAAASLQKALLYNPNYEEATIALKKYIE